MEFYCKSGERIHVDILGKGFPIVFLHGNNLQSSYFSKQRVLEKEFQLLFVDSLGHGKSGDLQGEISFAYLSDSLEELLSSLSIEKCLLVGHSDGANLALEYAGRHGERVAGILANSGNISFFGMLCPCPFLSRNLPLGKSFAIAILCFRLIISLSPTKTTTG